MKEPLETEASAPKVMQYSKILLLFVNLGVAKADDSKKVIVLSQSWSIGTRAKGSK